MNQLRQFLATRVYTGKYLFLDYWSILHLVLFFIIGMKFPGNWERIIVGSIIFEFIESSVSHNVSFLREKAKDTITDLALNWIGYWLGTIYLLR